MAAKWPFSEERRLDALRFAKRVRMDAMDAMDETQIELLIRRPVHGRYHNGHANGFRCDGRE